MKKLSGIICLSIIFACFSSSCKEKEKKKQPVVLTPKHTVQIDTSVSPVEVNVEKALRSSPTPLKLSRIASSIKYYPVGDSRFTVTQAIAVPDSNGAFITLNHPRIYYREPDVPSKRYGFKALNYKWNNEMKNNCMFYDKKTTRMYCALSGKNKEEKEDYAPCIGELPPLDTMLTITRYIFPETLEKTYPVQSSDDKLIGFSSAGYTTCYYEDDAGIPRGIHTYSLEGELLCRFPLHEDNRISREDGEEKVPSFHTSYWNEAQDRMNFMIPFCDTVFQQRDERTIAPLYNLHFGNYGIFSEKLEVGNIKKGKAWLRTLLENPKGLFMGVYEKEGKKVTNWLGRIDEFKPTLSHQVVYLKEENETYLIPDNFKGFINDLDGGLPFWPDGQTDNYLYMIRTVTEMREMVDRSPNSRVKKELLDFLNDETLKESYHVMIVVE